MKKTSYIFYILSLFVLYSCSSSKGSSKHNTSKAAVMIDENTFMLNEVSEDKTYGYTQKNPIDVGGVKEDEGPLNERRFLNALAGPNGEQIEYERLGSCCPFNTENGLMGSGLLDTYQVTWYGQTEPVMLYINMYDFSELKAPKGFTIKNYQK